MLGLEPSPITGRRGSVINFASLLSFQGGLTVPAYAASKGAVAQLTKALSNEWTAKGVTVNASKYLKDEETCPEENCGTGFLWSWITDLLSTSCPRIYRNGNEYCPSGKPRSA